MHRFSAPIQRYISLLKDYNELTNVYSKKAYDSLPFHVNDSLTLASLIGNKALTVVDMGSGSGLPSIIIALTNPNNTLIALESKSRKTVFLEKVAKALGLSNYNVVNQNIMEYCQNRKKAADIITAKAFGPLSKSLLLAKKLAKKGGHLYVPISAKQSEKIQLIDSKDSRIIKPFDSPYIYFMKTF